MNFLKTVSVAAVCLAALSLSASSMAASLGVSIGGSDGGPDVSVDAQLGGTSADADLTLGGDSAADLDLNVGNVNGSATVLGNDSSVDAKLGIGNSANAGANVLADGGNSSVTLDLSGLGLGDLSGLGLDDLLGSAGGNGAVGTNGSGGLVASVGRGSVGGGQSGACSIPQGRQVLQAAANGAIDARGWGRASNVAIAPVRLCAATKAQLSKVFRQSPKINTLQGAVASDPLISASLQRTRYDASDVFAVSRSGSQLTVYVY